MKLRCATCQSLFRRIMNEFKRYMKLVEHFGNIGWKVHELACNLYEIEFALLQRHLTKGV
jgi:hypothetical protein